MSVGKFLKDKIFAPGARFGWDTLIREATQDRLSTDALYTELNL